MKKRLLITAIFFSVTLYALHFVHDKSPIFQSTESFTTQKKIDPQYNSFEEIFKHANNLFMQEKYKDAVYFYKKALDLHPTCAHTFFNLGQAYFWQKKYNKALQCYKKTIKYQPTHHRAYAQIGKIFVDVKQYDKAQLPLERAIELDPKNIENLILLSRAYSDQQQFDKALELLEKNLIAQPHNIQLIFSLANVYNHLNRFEEALTLYKKLDVIAPNTVSILYNIGFTLKQIGLTQESLKYYNRAIALQPDHSDALFSRGLAYLVLGDFEKGWEGYEYRYHKPQQGCLRSLTQPRWDGSDLTGKTILLHAEQGFGDTIQFIRYAQLIKETKHATIIAAVQKPLVKLMQRCPYIDIVIAVDDIAPTFDVHAPLMSLPFILKTTIDTVPCNIPYLFADEQLTQQWKKNLDENPNFKVGICVQGNENYCTPQLRMTVARKSIQAAQLAPICAIPGVSVYCLQKTTGTDQFKNLPENINIIVFDGDFDNSNGRFMDTVSVIENLDIVITVDTSIGHLAGALGKLTWILLPNPADWRWMMDRNDTPWYPNVRLFKQPKPGDWETMIAEVAKELARLVENKKSLISTKNIPS
jgi:tetratricopeptide (TPR) repeat protein